MAAKKAVEQVLTIAPPKIEVATFEIVGTSPYVQNAFSEKARSIMRATQEAGSGRKRTKNAREAKDFQACYAGAMHMAEEGWNGIPAGGIRASLISACRVAGYTMTRAKLALFVIADGFDKEDGTALVRITKGKPEYVEHHVRNDSGVPDIRPRPMWREGWECVLRVRYDADQLSATDVANLIMRAGMQVGWGEGRADSKKSAGMGWGFFEIKNGKGGAK